MKINGTGRFAVALAAAVLVSCGGGDSGSSGGGGTVVAPPAPTPSPTATFSYQSARDFSQNRGASGPGTRLDRFRTGGQRWRTLSFETFNALAAGNFSFVAATPAYQVDFFGESRTFTGITAIPSGLSSEGDWNQSNSVTNNQIELFIRSVDAGINFVGTGYWRSYSNSSIVGTELGERETFRAMLYGAPTFPADLPRAGGTNYRSPRGPILTPTPPNVGTTDYRYTMDWVSGEFTSVTIVPCEDPNQCPNGNLGEVRLTGRLIQSTQLRGTISGSAGYTGDFVGGFYGPGGQELGLIGNALHPTLDAQLLLVFANRVQPGS